MNSQLYITARMMFSLSRAGHAPARFGRLNANGSPSAAMLLSSAGIGIAAALNAAFPESAFTLMISVSMFGAPIGSYADVARCADDLGFEALWIPEHLALPLDYAAKYPYQASGKLGFSPDTPFADPWVMFGHLAAVTKRLQFGVGVFVQLHNHRNDKRCTACPSRSYRVVRFVPFHSEPSASEYCDSR